MTAEHVTYRFALLEMCLEWKLSPHIYDALPWPVRQEMERFWMWRNERLRARAQTTRLNAKPPTGRR